MEILFTSTILILSILIIYLLWYIMNSRKKLSGGEESEILTLLTEFKHVADMKIASLEDKSDKLKFQLKRANETIARLTSVITDAEKMIDVLKSFYEEEAEKEVKKKNNVDKDHFKNPPKSNNKKIVDTDSLEESLADGPNKFNEKVLKLYNEGWSVDDIARMLDKGKGEVKLILNFNNLKKGGIK
jgi:ABC-type multidrug transport system fused ATPase/permease subunit